MSIVQPAGSNANFPYPWIALDPNKLNTLLTAEESTTNYGLGAKINPLSLQPTDADWPGSVDCSGEFRWLLYNVLGQPAGFESEVPDGSVNQHAWLVQNQFKMSTYADAQGKDNYIRVGVLSPNDTPEGIGHIWMVYNNNTIESYGSNGPGSRVLSQTPILSGGHYFVLTPPSS